MYTKNKWIALLSVFFLVTTAFAQTYPSYLKVSGSTITGYAYGVPTNLIIPTGITKIKDHALMCCTAIKSVTVPGEVELEPGAFSGCTSLERVKIEEGVKKIGYCAFAKCTSLVRVSIPGSATYIGDDLFGYCEKIKEVLFGGTKAQWQSFKVSLNRGATVRCTDGDITIQ